VGVNSGSSASDLIIWEYARKNEFAILTKDNDFDERSQLLGCPPKVIHLICGNKSTQEIQAFLLANKVLIINFFK
jgi:predicted nuclease of predicted toxin-antitoxin system